MSLAGQQVAGLQIRKAVLDVQAALVRTAQHEPLAAQFHRPFQTHRTQHFSQCMERVVMEIGNPCCLVFRHQSTLAQRVLCGNAGRASVGVTVLGLNAADGEHETTGRIDPVRPQRDCGRDIGTGDDLAAGPYLDLVPQPGSDQCVMNKGKTFTQRRADGVGEFQGCRAGAAFLAVVDNEIGNMAGFDHGFQYRHEFPAMPDTKLESDRFAIRQLAQFAQKFDKLPRRIEGGVIGGRDTVDTHWHTPGFRNFRGDLGSRQDSAMSGFCPL